MKYSGMEDKTEFTMMSLSPQKDIIFPSSKSLLDPLNKWLPIFSREEDHFDRQPKVCEW